ncbi:MAG: hypothetical protein AAGI92_12965, partial [Pseudomonadota bacterium]
MSAVADTPAFVATELVEQQAPPPKIPKPWNAARIWGYALLGLWVTMAVATALWLYGSWDPVKIERYAPRYLNGI